ncbi:dimethyl sulfoxide reductase anchor subunit family protein [Antarcticimicrobium sediminis]|uniref:Dibenzothiophene desulfurase n=1 Tax=Antarcticimicrobium sediminis TaxID=2546227 RepID=A0A4R5EVY3_9RHOB|nr:DmsC/YnfH family molybdoenzyme membrane anchor subunit [Antarcticimicrobium sediminis]TDE39002.1 dibenzothiophene desulfurase [Antarcticimicrobium sediminis]
MHPAKSVIAFTTLSGLGFGLLIWLGLGAPAVTGRSAFAFFTIAYLLATGGLIASAFHLGHPERGLKAFTQWRTSWLSREGWAALLALGVMAAYGAGLVFLDTRWALLGWLGAGLSLGTVVTTAMIYTQLKSVPRWHMALTPALFLCLSLAGGALLAGQTRWAVPLLILAGGLQIAHWRRGDGALARSGTTLATATGLTGGSLRAFEPPHTGPNYLLREMVHVVGRRHATKLRVIALALMSVVPVVLLLAPFSHALAALAVLSHLTGVLTARWLFFAEAEHVVGFYYGAR